MRIRGRYIGHVCFFDPTCWRHYFELGSPLGIYVGKRHWHVLKNTKRFERIWDVDNPVYMSKDGAVFRERLRGVPAPGPGDGQAPGEGEVQGPEGEPEH